MYSVIVDTEAYSDIDDIMAWYETQHKGLGIDFLMKFDETVARIRQNPFSYQAEYLSFRRVFIERFPYKIYYAVKEVRQQIQILAVFHQKQNPSLIQKRLGI